MAENRSSTNAGEDDELSIPRAALNKMIKEIIPNIRVANDSRELILNCCTEFIHLVSSEANDICNKSNKKTISPEHVLQGNFFLSIKLIIALWIVLYTNYFNYFLQCIANCMLTFRIIVSTKKK